MNILEMLITYFGFLCLAFRAQLLQVLKLPRIMKTNIYSSRLFFF